MKTIFKRFKLILGILVFAMSFAFSSCTMNDDDELFEPPFEKSAKDHNEDADPDIDEPNGG